MVHYYHKHTSLLIKSNDTPRIFFLQLAIITYDNANKLMIQMHIHDSHVTTMALAD